MISAQQGIAEMRFPVLMPIFFKMIKSTMQLLRVLFSYIGLTEVRCGAGEFEFTLPVTAFAVDTH